MTRSLNLLRGVLLAAAAQLAVFHVPVAGAATIVAPVAGAASITINNDNCASFTVSGTPGNQTLDCIASTSSVPVCSVTGAANAVVNSSITLTASCTGSPISHAWTGGNCLGGTGATCSASESAAGSVAYSVTATNGNGTGNPSAAKTVNWTTTALPSCTLSASPSTVPSTGGIVTLTATCTGNPTQWSWTGGFAAGSTSTNSQGGVSTTPGTTFTVAGINDGGTGSPASVTVGLSSGGSTGNVAISSCPGYTAAQTKVLDVKIPASGFTKYIVTTAGLFRDGKAIGFGPNEVMVVVFKAPPADPAWQLTFVQTGDGAFGPSATRTITLSNKPCDFQYPKGPDALWSGESPNLSLTLASGTSPSAYSRYLLVPGQEYYLNIRNKTTSGGGCSSTRCDISFATANNAPN